VSDGGRCHVRSGPECPSFRAPEAEPTDCTSINGARRARGSEHRRRYSVVAPGGLRGQMAAGDTNVGITPYCGGTFHKSVTGVMNDSSKTL